MITNVCLVPTFSGSRPKFMARDSGGSALTKLGVKSLPFQQGKRTSSMIFLSSSVTTTASGAPLAAMNASAPAFMMVPSSSGKTNE